MGRISEYLESCHSSLGQVVMACFLTMTLAIPSNFAPILAEGNIDESVDIETTVDTEPNAEPVVEDISETVESATEEEATPLVEEKAAEGLNVDVEWVDSSFDMKDLTFTEGKNVVWESEKTSTKRFTMRINYSDANCTNGYDAGALEIRVPLVADLTDDLIFADSNLANPTHDFNYRYSDEKPDGTRDLILRNNNAIPAGNNFTGTIQVIWQITNRGADRSWDISAVSTATDKEGNTYEITGENTLSLSIKNTKDVFAPTFTASKMTDIANMEGDWRDYIWVQYKFEPGQTKKSMPLVDGMYIFDVPSDCVVYNDGVLSPSTNSDSKFFKRIGKPNEPETISFSIGWPRETYDGQVATLTGYMTGTYANGDKLNESDAASTWSANLNAADYDFTYEGDKFAITQSAEYVETNTGILDGSQESVENSLYFHVDAIGRNYPGEKYTYEILTDWFDITTNRNGYRALEANEISRISIYAPTGILDASGNARKDQNELVGKVYAYDANNVETFVGELKGISTGYDNDIVLPAGTAYGKIVYENVDGYVHFDNIDVIYETKVQTFDRNGTGMDDDLSPLTGTVRHNAGLIATNASGVWANTVGPESYTGSQSEMAYNRDMNRYGHAVQRAYGEMKYHEAQKSVVSYNQNLKLQTSGSPSTSTEFIRQQMWIDWTATGHWSGDDKSVRPQYTNLTFMVELPTGWEYSPNQNWTTVTSKKYPIKTTVTKVNGKTMVRYDVDTSSSPLESAPDYDLWSELSFYFNMQIPLDMYYECGQNYTLKAWSWVNGELSGATQVAGSSTTTDVRDLNGNGDVTEIIGSATAQVRLDAALGSHLEANERVQAASTSGSWENTATTTFGEEYSYKLGFMTGSTAVTDVVMYDTIEQGSDWHGTLTEIDTSWLANKGYNPKVYLSVDADAPNDITDDAWETLDFFAGTKPLASAVRVAIALEGDTVPGSSYVRAVLKMKASENENDIAGTARDFYTVNFTNKEGTAMTLTSGEVSVLLADKYGKLTITKRDATDQSLMPTAKFNVLNGSGVVVLKDVAPGTYDLPTGTYTVVESSVPTGYVTPETAFGPVTVVENDTVSIDIENERKSGSIRIVKNDATSGAPMEGVTFTAALNGEVVAEATTNASGIALFEGLAWGTYTIVEKEVPQGYVAMTPMTVNLTRTNSDPLKPVEQRVTNQRNTGTVEIRKVDSITGKPVSGATFRLYEGNSNIAIASAVTDSTGVAIFTNVIWGKQYSVKETTAPTGYTLDSTRHSVELSQENCDEKIVLSLENDPILGKVQVNKVDAVDGSRLTGAMFDLLQNGKVIRTGLTTNALGYLTISDLPWGVYLLRETKAPVGYANLAYDTLIQVTAANCSTTQIVNVKNTKTHGDLRIVKYDVDEGTDFLLEGATLRVTHTATGETFTVDSSSTEASVISNVPYGTYSIEEIASPAGYKKLDEPITFEFSQTNETCFVGNEKWVDNRLIIPIDKYGIVTGSDERVKLDASDAEWSGSAYSMVMNDFLTSDQRPDMTFPVTDGQLVFYHEPGSGEVSLGNWPLGWYRTHSGDNLDFVSWCPSIRVTETKAPDGYSNMSKSTGRTKSFKVSLYTAYEGTDNTYIAYKYGGVGVSADHYFVDEVGLCLVDDDGPSEKVLLSVPISATNLLNAPIRFMDGFSSPTVAQMYFANYADDLWDKLTWSADPIVTDAAVIVDEPMPQVKFNIKKQGLNSDGTVDELDASLIEWTQFRLSDDGTACVQSGDPFSGSSQVRSINSDTFANASVSDKSGWFSTSPYRRAMLSVGETKAIKGYSNQMVKGKPGVIDYTGFHIAAEAYYISNGKRYNYSTTVPSSGSGSPVSEIGFRIWDAQSPSGRYVKVASFDSYKIAWGDGKRSVSQIAVDHTDWWPAEVDLGDIVVDNQALDCGLTVQKVDSDTKQPLGGAEFTIDFVKRSPLGIETRSSDVWEDTTNTAGYFETLDHYPYKFLDFLQTYWPEEVGDMSGCWTYLEIKETKAPFGYKLPGSIMFGDEAGEPGVVARLTYNYDIDATGMTEAEKRDKAMSLNAPYIALDSWNDLTIENAKPITTLKFTKLESGSNKPMSGVVFDVEMRDVNNDWVVVDTVTTGTEGEFLYSTKVLGEYRVVERPVSGYEALSPMRVSISDENSGDTILLGDTGVVYNSRKTSTLTVQKIDKDTSLGLAGAKFDLYDWNGNIVATDIVTDDNGQAVISGVNVSLSENELYYLVETQVPDGYMVDIDVVEYIDLLDAWAVPVLVSQPNELIAVTNDSAPELGEVVIHKQDSSNNTPLAGAVFGLYNQNGDLVVTAPATDESGFVKFYAPIGDYVLRELVSPDGYIGEAIEMLISVGSVISITCMNDLLPGNVVISKTDAESRDPLAGAVFGLYTTNESGALVEVNRAITNEDGVVEFTGIEWGTSYQVKEIKAPAGYVLSDRIESVLLDRDSMDVADRTFTFEWTNDRALGQVVLTKTDEAYPDIVVQGAQYMLRDRATGETLYDDLITDHNGQLVINDLLWGEYEFVETCAPHDYILDETPVPFVVNASNSDALIKVSDTNAKQGPIDTTRSITVVKRIDAKHRDADVVTTVFECIGSDGSRVVQSLDFSQNVSEKTCHFRGLNADVAYTVREIGSLRYEENITECENGTVNDDGSVLFEATAESGRVVVTNEQIIDEDLTGRSSVRNVLGSNSSGEIDQTLRTVIVQWLGGTIGDDGTLGYDSSDLCAYGLYPDGTRVEIASDQIVLDLSLHENVSYSGSVRAIAHVTAGDRVWDVSLDVPVEWDASTYHDKAWVATYGTYGNAIVVMGVTSEVPDEFNGKPLVHVYGSEYLDYSNSTNYLPWWRQATLTGTTDLGTLGEIHILDPIYPTSLVGWFSNVSKIVGLENLYADDVTNMNRAFYQFNGSELDLSHWNVAKVTDTRNMFAYSYSLKTIYASRTTNFAHVSSTMSRDMFKSCSLLKGGCGTRVTDITNNGSVTSAAQAHIDQPGKLGLFTGPITLLNSVVYSADDNSLNFYNRDVDVTVGDIYDGRTVSWVTTGVSSSYSNAANRPWSKWSSSVKTVRFIDDTRFASVSELFKSYSKLERIEGWENVDFSKNTSFYYMFAGCSALTEVDVSTWDVSSLTNTQRMFNNCSSLERIYANADTNWRVSAHLSKANSTYMFYGCYKLVGSDGFAYDSGKVNYLYAQTDGLNNSTGYFYHRNPKPLTDAVVYSSTDGSLRFYDRDVEVATGDTYEGRVVDKVWNNIDWSSIVSQATVPWGSATAATKVNFEDDIAPNSMAYWFSPLTSLTSVEGFDKLDTSNVTSMAYTFANTRIREFDMGWFNDLSSVTNMESMFENNKSLRSWSVGIADLSSVTDVPSMFNGDTNLTTVSIAGWPGENIKDSRSMFYGNTALTKIMADENTDWSHIKSASYMFYNCSKLVGGNGTSYNYSWHDACRAVVDGLGGKSGYFTYPVTCDLSDGVVIYSATDNSLRFYNREGTITQGDMIDGRESTYIYANGWQNEYSAASAVPWYSVCSKITTVEIMDVISPASLAYWFYGMDKVTELDLRNVQSQNVSSTSYMVESMSALEDIWFNADLPIDKNWGLSPTSTWWDDNFVSHVGSEVADWLATVDSLSEVHLYKTLQYNDDIPVTHSYAAWYSDGSLVFGEGALIDQWHEGFSLTGYIRGVSDIRLGKAPWSEIKSIVWPENFAPKDTSRWFYGFYTLSSEALIDVSGWNMTNVVRANEMFSWTQLSTIYADSDTDWSFIPESIDMFTGANNLQGSNGFVYDSTKVSAEYARMDGVDGQEGYFSTKEKSLLNAAVYSADENTLHIYNRDEMVSAGDTYDGHSVDRVYTGINVLDRAPWYDASHIIFEDTIQPVSIQNWFDGISSVQNWENLDTSQCIDMSYAFSNSQLEEIDVRNFDMSSVEQFFGMFSCCYNLRTIYANAGTDWSTLGVSSDDMFNNTAFLKGMLGTSTYDSFGNPMYTSVEAARIDGGESSPGLFTDPEVKIVDYTVRTHKGNVLSDGIFFEANVSETTERAFAGDFVTVEPKLVFDDFTNEYTNAKYYSYVDVAGDRTSSRQAWIAEDGSTVFDLYYVESQYGQLPYDGYEFSDYIYPDPVGRSMMAVSWNNAIGANGWVTTSSYDGNLLRMRLDKVNSTKLVIPYYFYGPQTSSCTLQVEFFKCENGTWESKSIQSIDGRALEYMSNSSEAVFDIPEEEGVYCIDINWLGLGQYYSYPYLFPDKMRLR